MQIRCYENTFGKIQTKNKKIVFFSYDYTNYIELSLLGLFVFSLIIQVIYYLGIYRRFTTYKRSSGNYEHPVSVIICARNEADNLQKNLPSILEQSHKEFEVVVVNDCSTDDTEIVLNVLVKKYKKLRVTNITQDPKFTHGKKLALTVGIKAATHEWLVFTDADCCAESDQWLNRLQENFSEKTEIVLGYGGYRPYKGILNRYIRFDTLFIAMQYFSFALCGFPYMGVGRNLAYRKSLFFRNKGFASHYNLISGDDDLFVNETANRTNTAIEFDPASHTLSEPKFTLKKWLNQKRRHLLTANRYKGKHIFLLGAEPFTRVLFYVTFISLLFTGTYMYYVLGAGVLRFVIIMIIFKKSMNRLLIKNLLPWIIIFDFFSLLINFILYLTTSFRSKKIKWK